MRIIANDAAGTFMTLSFLATLAASLKTGQPVLLAFAGDAGLVIVAIGASWRSRPRGFAIRSTAPRWR